MDIIKYLQESKKLSAGEIAAAMNTTVSRINEIISHKQQFTAEDLDSYLKSSNLHFWEFAIESIPLNHLSEKAKSKILLCEQLSKNIKKKYKK